MGIRKGHAESRGISRRVMWLLVAVVVLGGIALPSLAETDEAHLQSDDPLGLLPGMDILRQYSLGTDTIEVWTCEQDRSAASYVEELKSTVAPWFLHQSRGRYRPDFVVGGDIPASGAGVICTAQIADESDGTAAAVMEIGDFGFGHGGAGYTCGFSPCPGAQNWGRTRRGTHIPIPVQPGTVAHEMGHTLRWPHSFAERIDDPDIPGEYDNVMDLMSGTLARWEEDGQTVIGTSPLPYDTAIINKYAAGWIDPYEVYTMAGGGAALDLTTVAGDGYQMALIQGSGDSFYTLQARVPGDFDAIPSAWAGVEVYKVIPCPYGGDGMACEDDPDYALGFRRIIPEPAVAADSEDDGVFDRPPPHVISVGNSRMVGGVPVEVVGSITDGFRVSIGPEPVDLPNPERPRFVDTAGHLFEGEIDWLAAEGVTKGCNPPVNDRFCPDEHVTRGQMAAFLVRALGLDQAPNNFGDDDGSVFEADIGALAAAGITKGCNPPVNDRFCPDEHVTRGQMAAFLVRALGLEQAQNSFGDDDGSVFEADIGALAAAGVTRGCNPPQNTRFCPDDPVTRGQMAAFLQRATR